MTPQFVILSDLVYHMIRAVAASAAGAIVVAAKSIRGLAKLIYISTLVLTD
jgi:hypothetical protein